VDALFKNLILTTAIVISLVVHGVALLLHFSQPAPDKSQPDDPGLEIILVNAKHDTRPLKAQALAQADLDGGGTNDAGRSKSPLPDMKNIQNGDTLLVTKKRIEELEDRQQKLLDQATRKTELKSPQLSDKIKTEENKPDPVARDLVESSKTLARRVAEISETIEDQNKRPRKTYLGPSTQGVGYAIYYKEMQKRIENIGTLNFPVHNGKKLYGELIVYIPISRNGQLYKKEGGPSIAKSSGNAALDAATLRIIERSAPFGVFPRDLLEDDKDHVWIFSTKFKFTREQLLHTEVRGGDN